MSRTESSEKANNGINGETVNMSKETKQTECIQN
jgi:hypothetical protein